MGPTPQLPTLLLRRRLPNIGSKFQKYGESLQTARRANELEANAETLELIGTTYTLAAQAFDAEANAWMALAVWSE